MGSRTLSLNVGGIHYTTSTSTLMKYPDSMFGRMLNSSIDSEKDENGAYFIDRDGPLFRHVLNFMRNGTLSLPENFNELKLLKSEADFYQIQPLIAALDNLKPGNNQSLADGFVVDIFETMGLAKGSNVDLRTYVIAPDSFFTSPHFPAGTAYPF